MVRGWVGGGWRTKAGGESGGSGAGGRRVLTLLGSAEEPRESSSRVTIVVLVPCQIELRLGIALLGGPRQILSALLSSEGHELRRHEPRALAELVHADLCFQVSQSGGLEHLLVLVRCVSGQSQAKKETSN